MILLHVALELMLRGIIKGSQISISIKNGNQICVGQFCTTNNPVALSAKFFLISCLCMQRVGNNKIFLYSHDTEKAFVTSAKGSMVCTKRTLVTEHLA